MKEGIIDLDKYPDLPSSNMWISELALSETDKSVIEKMEWLNDNHMYAAQTLLKNFPHLSGLLATTVVASRKAIPVDGDTVQILNVDNCHWICIAVDRKNPDTVRVYDSMYASLSLSSQQQICALLH